MLWIVDISAPAENWKNLTSTLELQVAATSSGLDEYGETMIYCIYIIYIYMNINRYTCLSCLHIFCTTFSAFVYVWVGSHNGSRLIDPVDLLCTVGAQRTFLPISLLQTSGQ